VELAPFALIQDVHNFLGPPAFDCDQQLIRNSKLVTMSGKRKMGNMETPLDTDELVQEALREVEEKKKAKKQAQSGLYVFLLVGLLQMPHGISRKI
jgi:hypothetical protein